MSHYSVLTLEGTYAHHISNISKFHTSILLRPWCFIPTQMPDSKKQSWGNTCSGPVLILLSLLCVWCRKVVQQHFDLSLAYCNHEKKQRSEVCLVITLLLCLHNVVKSGYMLCIVIHMFVYIASHIVYTYYVSLFLFIAENVIDK